MTQPANPQPPTEFMRRLLKRRTDLHLTQDDAAARSGMSLRQYQRLEYGETRRITMEDVAKLAVGLDTNSDYLAGNTNDDRPIVSQTSLSLVERVVDYLTAGDRMSAIQAISEEDKLDRPNAAQS